MAPKGPCKIFLGHKKWEAILYIAPTFKSGELSPPPAPPPLHNMSVSY